MAKNIYRFNMRKHRNCKNIQEVLLYWSSRFLQMPALEPLFGLLNFAFFIWHTQTVEAFHLQVAVCNTQSAHEQYNPWCITTYSIMTYILHIHILPHTSTVTCYCKLCLYLFLRLCSILTSKFYLRSDVSSITAQLQSKLIGQDSLLKLNSDLKGTLEHLGISLQMLTGRHVSGCRENLDILFTYGPNKSNLFI